MRFCLLVLLPSSLYSSISEELLTQQNSMHLSNKCWVQVFTFPLQWTLDVNTLAHQSWANDRKLVFLHLEMLRFWTVPSLKSCLGLVWFAVWLLSWSLWQEALIEDKAHRHAFNSRSVSSHRARLQHVVLMWRILTGGLLHIVPYQVYTCECLEKIAKAVNLESLERRI